MHPQGRAAKYALQQFLDTWVTDWAEELHAIAIKE